MKSILHNVVIVAGIFCIAIVALNSCDQSVKFSSHKYGNVFIPQAQENPFKYSFILNDDSAATIDYSAVYAGPKRKDGGNITLQFAVDSALADSFNVKNSTSYKMLPENSYIMSETEAKIATGEESTPTFQIELKKENIQGGGTQYLLPITLNVKSGGIELDKDLQTVYFLIQGTYQEYNKADWKITECNHPSKYPCSNLIDNNSSTFYNSTYKGSNDPPPPHYIAVDMGESHKIHGFRILGRPGSKAYTWRQNPKEITIQFSNDGKNWRDGQDFTLPFNTEVRKARIFLSGPVKAHYFRLTIKSNVESADVTNFNEIYAF